MKKSPEFFMTDGSCTGLLGKGVQQVFLSVVILEARAMVLKPSNLP